MSSSVSIRSLALSAEQRAEQVRQARVNRLAERFLPALAQQAADHVQLATSCGQLSAADGQAFRQHLGSVSSVDEVRQLVATLPSVRGSVTLPTATNTIDTAGRGAAPAADDINFTSGTFLPAGTVPTAGNSPFGPAATTERLAASGSLPAVGSLRPSAERLPAGPSSLPSTSRLPSRDDHRVTEAVTALANARWELTTEGTRLAALAEEAADLGLDLGKPAATADALLRAAQRAADAGALGLLTSQVRAAAKRIDEAEAALDEVIIGDAAHKATIDELRRIAEDQLGFTVAVVDRDGGSAVAGTTADGRTLELHLEQAGDHDVLVSTVTDIGNALPEGASGSDELCDSSIATAQALHRAIDETGVLDGGKVSVTKAPTRGQPDAGGAATAASRRAQTVSYKQMRRIR